MEECYLFCTFAPILPFRTIVLQIQIFINMRNSIILGLLLLVAAGCSDKPSGTVAKAPVRVKVTELSPVGHDAATTYVGTVEEREATAVSFTGMGVVRRVLVSEGQAVRRGQLLAEMDDTQARNVLAGAEAAMAQANDALARYAQLHEAGSLPEVQWVEIQSKVAQAQSQLAVARKNLADCRLVAPVSGIIGRKMLGAGETAMPSQAVVTILDIATVKVRVAVPEAEVAAIGHNTSSIIKVEAAGITTRGGHIEKGIVADAMTHTYDVRISVANGDGRLLPGMVASVQLSSTGSTAQSEADSNDYRLPVTAVQKRADGQLFVWAVEADSTVHRSNVVTGAVTGNDITISAGLQQGQRIVVEGYQKLSEGTKVEF